jgi:hypothetical protein
MGQFFALAKEFIEMSPDEIEMLLESEVHEVRAGVLSIMDKQAAARRRPKVAGRNCSICTSDGETRGALDGSLGRQEMSGLLYIATLATALGCGLIAGVFFAFSSFVLPAHKRLPSAEGISARTAAAHRLDPTESETGR